MRMLLRQYTYHSVLLNLSFGLFPPPVSPRFQSADRFSWTLAEVEVLEIVTSGRRVLHPQSSNRQENALRFDHLLPPVLVNQLHGSARTFRQDLNISRVRLAPKSVCGPSLRGSYLYVGSAFGSYQSK
jgi:hypothetical protein